MNRRNRKPRAPQAPDKQRADQAAAQLREPEANDPFVTFTEWSSEADEKAYAESFEAVMAGLVPPAGHS